MKQKHIFLIIGLFLSVLECMAQTTAVDWPAIRRETKPWTRWWWLGSAVDSANITYNLEALSRAGIGGVEITPIYGVKGGERQYIDYLSPRWMKMLAFTEAEAKRLDMSVDMNNGTGWPFGGPEVTTEDAATKAIFKDNRLEIGKTGQQVKRAAPGGQGNVLDHLNKEAVIRYFSKFDKAFAENHTPFPNSFFNDSYEAYGADWTPGLLNEFEQRRGYRLQDYFSDLLADGATERSARVIADYRETVSDILHDNFTQVWTDWAHSHGATTRNQAHGSPANLLDLYALVDIPECESFGITNFDIPGLRKDSIFKKNDSNPAILKYASSAAHVAGKKYTSSETFTWLTEHFRTSLSQCKPEIDFMFAAGVNHVFFHGTTYSPKEAAWPGWKFYAAIDLSPTNSIWRDAPAFFDYITRCQSFLQSGVPDNDFLLYFPVYDIWHEKRGNYYVPFAIHDVLHELPEFEKSVEWILSAGYDLDYISDRLLQNVKVENGLLNTGKNAQYKYLIIPSVKRIPLETLSKILELKKQGANVIFEGGYPKDVPGLYNLEERRKTFAGIMEQIRNLPDSIMRAPRESFVTDFGGKMIRRKNADGYHYFMSMLQNNTVDGWVSISVKAESAVFFDPMTGQKGKAKIRQNNGKSEVYMQLKPGQSIILKTFTDKDIHLGNWNYFEETGKTFELNNDWHFKFIESEPAVKQIFELEKTGSWTDLPNDTLKINMATARYSKTFNFRKEAGKEYLLSLGDVRESAVVRLNGKKVTTLFAVPFETLIGEQLKEGENLLEIEVTNLPANRIADYDRRGVEWRIFHEINFVDIAYSNKRYDGWAPVPSGLLGPVVLREMSVMEDFTGKTEAKQKPKVIFIGDSTVKNGSGDGRNGQWGWGDQIACYFDTAKISVINQARGGRSSRTYRSEGLWDNVLETLRPGDYVLIQFGHNDASPVNDTLRARGTLKGTGEETEDIVNLLTHKQETVHSFGWYLRRYVRETQTRGATPVLLSPIPRNNFKDGKIIRNADNYGGWVRQIAEAENVPFIDLNTLSANELDRIAATYGQTVIDSAYYYGDHTHTSLAGAKLNARCVVESIQALENCHLKDYLFDEIYVSPLCNGTEKKFSIVLPEGDYDITLVLGSSDQSSETTVRAESRRLILEKIKTKKGQYSQQAFTVNIRNKRINADADVKINLREQGKLNWDDKLTLEFSGVNPSVQRIGIRPAKNPVRIFIAGNSTVVDQDNEPWCGWGQMIPRFFGQGASFANYAESGETAAGFIAAGRLAKLLTQAQAGDYLFIEFGHNDQKQQGEGIGPWSSFTSELKIFIAEARKRGMIPVLLTPVQRRKFDEKGKIINTHGEYPDAIRRLADQENVPLIDLHRMTTVLYEVWGEKASTQAFVHYPANTFPGQPEDLKDDTHFNAYGGYEIARCVVEGIRENNLTGILPFLRPEVQVPAMSISNKNAVSLVSSKQVSQILIDLADDKLIEVAANLLADDIKAITEKRPEIIFSEQDIRSETVIIAGSIGHSTWIDKLIETRQLNVTPIVNQWEAYSITTLENVSPKIRQAIVIAGSDKRGTAYGLLDISRQIGVSPWRWWADALPDKQTELYLTTETRIEKGPSVQFRGIFINDEDWGLLPWSNQTYEPSTIKGHIGPATYQRIFELLLRLRANTLWPAMHESTLPFYFTEGNKEMADRYGIYIGTSHCEPLMRNAAGEWTTDGNGDYDYVNNSQTVYRFWEQRIRDVAGQDNIYTLGMRGVHDGKMQGAQTQEEQKTVLTRVFNDQRELLKKYIDQDLQKIPQVFIPYKEVLDIYHAGLQVPDDVTLMWCDDNYGYIRHFPDERERKRSGGNGVYYHVSYWGRPHDYLWLGTAHPALIYQQMKQAYHSGIQKIWILNVGDIKPSEYQIELFLDMAWDLDKITAEGTSAHLKQWLKREFGNSCAEQLLSVMQEHYRLSYIRKPEFMGHTRVEENDPAYKIVKDLPWSEKEIKERLLAYNVLSGKTEKIAALIPDNKQDAYFELIKYPVQAATQMNRKLLYAQLARHGIADWRQSDTAYDSIASLTHDYNTLNNGKWNRMMDAQPRKLPVFERVKQTAATQPLPPYRRPLYLFNGTDYASTTDKQLSIEELGYENKAVALSKGCNISFQINELPVDSIEVEIRLLPNHPVEGHQLRFGIASDDSPMKTVSYQTEGRSEEWKENVLRNQSIRRVVFPVNKQLKRHSLTLTAIDAGVVIDEVLVYSIDNVKK